MSNGSPVRLRARVLLAPSAFLLLACGSATAPAAPESTERGVATPWFDGSSPPPPAPRDTGSTAPSGNYQSPHV
jgi:hypothetical protein